MSRPSRVIAGVDGCRIGWIGIIEELDKGSLTYNVCSNFDELLDSADLILVDVPIGLSCTGSRLCDRMARSRLGRPRRSSVFSAPVREAVFEGAWKEASEVNRRVCGKGLSKQAWGIVPKIREVDALLRECRKLRQRVLEMHPELSFQAMNGGAPMKHSKKSTDGRRERREILTKKFGDQFDAIEVSLRRTYLKKEVADDDLFDAFAALGTARRVAKGVAETIPTEPEVDDEGVAMAMWI